MRGSWYFNHFLETTTNEQQQQQQQQQPGQSVVF